MKGRLAMSLRIDTGRLARSFAATATKRRNRTYGAGVRCADSQPSRVIAARWPAPHRAILKKLGCFGESVYPASALLTCNIRRRMSGRFGLDEEVQSCAPQLAWDLGVRGGSASPNSTEPRRQNDMRMVSASSELPSAVRTLRSSRLASKIHD